MRFATFPFLVGASAFQSVVVTPARIQQVSTGSDSDLVRQTQSALDESPGREQQVSTGSGSDLLKAYLRQDPQDQKIQ
jgi:hypothetical protein